MVQAGHGAAKQGGEHGHNDHPNKNDHGNEAKRDDERCPHPLEHDFQDRPEGNVEVNDGDSLSGNGCAEARGDLDLSRRRRRQLRAVLQCRQVIIDCLPIASDREPARCVSIHPLVSEHLPYLRVGVRAFLAPGES